MKKKATSGEAVVEQKNPLALLGAEKGAALSCINMETKVTMEDVVDLFAVKYEQKLKEKRKKIEKDRTDISERTKAARIAAIKAVDTKQFDTKHDIFKLKSASVDFSGKDNKFAVNLAFNVIGGRDGYPVNVVQSVAIPANTVKQLDGLNKEMEQNTKDLTEVLTEIRDIDSRRRLVRARITEQKLGAEGLEGLLNDPALLALVEIDG